MSERSKRIRFGVVGAGNNTRLRHIPGLQAIEGVDVVAVCNRSEDSARRVADTFGIAGIFGDWRSLVESDDIDAVVIGTWPNLHCPVTVAALDAGKHVMCEARMAMNLAEAREMHAASRRNPKCVAQVVPSPFTLGVDRTIKRLITQGVLGELLAIDLRANGNAFLHPQSPMSWRQDRTLSGLNTLMMGIWYEALMRWVGEARSLMAAGRIYVPERVNSESGVRCNVEVPEHVDIIADMNIGAQAHLQFSSVTGLDGENRVALYGREATLILKDESLWVGRAGDAGLSRVPIPKEDAGHWRVEEEFVNAIRELEPITHTCFADGVRYMAFTEAVADSIKSGRRVEVWHA